MTRAYNPRTEEVFTIKDDAKDPLNTGLVGKEGLTSFDKSAIARPEVRWKSFILTMDVYKMDDEVMVHLYCPRCHNALKISSKRKSIGLHEGKLSVEPFKCTWELDAERHEFGVGLCGWSVGIKDNVAYDHR